MKEFEAIKAIDNAIGIDNYFTEAASDGFPDEKWEIWITPIIATKKGKRWLHSKKIKIRMAGTYTVEGIAAKAKELVTQYPKGF